jgi:hypothetical protein
MQEVNGTDERALPSDSTRCDSEHPEFVSESGGGGSGMELSEGDGACS